MSAALARMEGGADRRRRFHVTYETVTPESAEAGDYDDCGFLDSQGQRRPVAGLWGAKAGALKAECAITLREALALFGWRYGAGLLEADAPSLRQPDGVQDYRTGEETRLALHAPDKVTAASFERVRRLVEGA